MRLYALVEGQTEAAFVKRVLAPHLGQFGVWAEPVTVTTRRARRSGMQYRGGGRWEHRKNDLRKLVNQHRGSDVRFTTLFDLYAIPADSPGFYEHGAVVDTVLRAERLERAMALEVNDTRFIPYLQRHEFEALVLACLGALQELLDPVALSGLAALRASIGAAAPEDVNDGAASAPSKRLKKHIPSYDKVEYGPLAIEATGLAIVREACPRFDAWLRRLEALAGAP